MPIIRVSRKNYAKFKYDSYVHDHKVIRKPKKSLYSVGDVVALTGKCENPDIITVGVVLGVIDDIRQELRTDTDGMVCFSECRHATFEDIFNRSTRISPVLVKDIDRRYSAYF